MIGISIIFYEVNDCLGSADRKVMSLGELMSDGLIQMFGYFGFTIFPAIVIIYMVAGFLLLYEGL